MKYKLGNGKHLHEAGKTQKLPCPKCGKTVNLSVFYNFEARLKASLPLITVGNFYFAVCPECASFFKIDKSNAQEFRKGTLFAIMAGDLKDLDVYEGL